MVWREDCLWSKIRKDEDLELRPCLLASDPAPAEKVPGQDLIRSSHVCVFDQSFLARIFNFNNTSHKTMSPAALIPEDEADATVTALRNTLCSETAPLAKRFRALFSLKHVAAQSPATPQTVPAIEAIAAALTSPSALLKHELAYCLGQSGKEEAVPFLRNVIEDRQEDAMCRHEAAEAIAALGDKTSLQLLKERRDDPTEEEVVRETCEIAVESIEWQYSESRVQEKLKQRFVQILGICLFLR